MKNLLLVALILIASVSMAALTPAEKAEAQTVLTVVENQAITVRAGQVFQQRYFKNCTFTGSGDYTVWHTCVFENCSFDLSFNKARFLWSYLDGGTFTKFEFKDSALQGSNVDPARADAKCRRGKALPTKKNFTDHIAKVKVKKNK